MNASKVKAFVDVYRLLKAPIIDGADVGGSLHLDTDASEKLTTLRHHSDIFSGVCKINGEDCSHYHDYIGQEATIEITVNNSFFYKDLDCFISIGDNKTKEPESYYIADIDYYFPEDTARFEIENYHNHIKFIGFLRSIADHCNNTDFIFLSREKLTIPISYNSEQLVVLPGLDNLINDFADGEKDLEQKKIIFKRVLVNMLKNIDEKLRFAELCQKFATLSSRYKDNYYLFLEDIDIDTITNEARKKKVEYLANIAKVYSDMQGKLLTIPITLIPLTQNKKDCLSSIIILCGIIIYVVFMAIYVFSQWRITSEIHKDKNEYAENLKSKYNEELYNNFKKILNGIDGRYNAIKHITYCIYFVLIVIVTINAYVLIYIPHFK